MGSSSCPKIFKLLSLTILFSLPTMSVYAVEEMKATTTCLKENSISSSKKVQERSRNVDLRQKKLNLPYQRKKKMSLLSRNRRTTMAKYMLEKLAKNQNEDAQEREKWYEVDVSQLSYALQAKFVKCHLDEETGKFLESSVEKSGFLFTQFYHSIARIFLGFMLSTTTLNGLLDRGKMFVFSNEQFKTLTGVEDACMEKTLLDLGAGDGTVTSTMAKYFRSVYVTESSSTMRYRLNQKGFKVLEIDEWQNSKFDFISVLNLLDRVDNPWKLLNDVRLSLNPNGTVLLAVVLPYSPWIEKGSELIEPSETLPISGKTAQSQVSTLVTDVIERAGFQVVKFTKLPYLCEGDLYEDFFYLYDYVFVLKAVDSL